MGSINRRVLEIVRDELNRQGENLVALAEQWQSSSDAQPELALVNTVQELRGVTSIIELAGPTRILTELMAALNALNEFEDTQKNDIHEAVVVCVHYMSFLLRNGQDNPLLILPELNKLREISKKVVISESSAMVEMLPEDLFVKEVEAKSQASKQAIRRARHLYQKALLHAIKDSNKPGAMRLLGHAVRQVHQSISSKSESSYWLIVLQVLDAFAKRNLNLTKTRLRTLMSLERQMRSLLTSGTEVDSCYPLEVQQQILAMFLLSGFHSIQAKRIADKLGLSETAFNEKQLKDDRALFCSEGVSSFADTMSVLKGEMDSISFFVERLEQGQSFDSIDRENLVHNLVSLSDICRVSGFAVANQRLSEHVETIAAEATDNLPEGMMGQLVDTLLYMECLLLTLSNEVPSEQELKLLNQQGFTSLIESNMLDHAKRLVLSESKDRLVEIMGHISEMETDFIDDSALSSINSNFQSIAGAVDIVGLEKASETAKACVSLQNVETMQRMMSQPELLSGYADVIVGLEYYLENCRWDMNADETALNNAGANLEMLMAS